MTTTTTIEPIEDTAPAARPGFVLHGPVRLTVAWNGSRWQRWRARLDYAAPDGLNPYDIDDEPTLYGSLTADHHATAEHALDTVTAAARLIGVRLDNSPLDGEPPRLAFHPYSTDGLAVRFPDWRPMLTRLAARRGWRPDLPDQDQPST